MTIHSYRKTVSKIEKRFCFYIHITIYLMVNSLLFLINLFTSHRVWWFYWPLFGWGIGLFFHYINTFFPFHEWLWEWKKREIRKIIEREKIR